MPQGLNVGYTPNTTGMFTRTGLPDRELRELLEETLTKPNSNHVVRRKTINRNIKDGYLKVSDLYEERLTKSGKARRVPFPYYILGPKALDAYDLILRRTAKGRRFLVDIHKD